MKKVMLPKSHSLPIGRYSPGVSYKINTGDTMVFVSGQVACDENGKTIGRNNPKIQTEYVFKKIESVLKESDGSLDDIVSLIIYVIDINYFDEVSSVRNSILNSSLPPSSTLVEVSSLAIKDHMVEISAVAIINNND